MAYLSDIVSLANANEFFRQVVHTGSRSQLVLMAIPVGGDVGMETHPHVEQTFVVVSGGGMAKLDGVTSPLQSNDVLVVPPGVEHNITNTGQVPLKLYTIYAPPNHIDGRVHKTKAEADADTEDEAFGETIT